MSKADHVPEVTCQLAAWAADTYGTAATVDSVHPMPGHSGHSFGFVLREGQHDRRLVVRLPPPGSNQRGSSDVLRQSRVMAAMARAGVPVPPIVHEGDGERWFGTPYYVAGWVEGRSTSLYREGVTHDEDGAGLAPVFRSGMETLAAIHAVDWQTELAGWASPTSLADEIAKWQPTLRKSTNEAWIEGCQNLAARLLETMPEVTAPSVTHGDYYSNNWLFDDARITAVVDWEIAGIGAPGLDLGWVSMFYDDACWGPSRHRWESWSPTPESLFADYERAAGRALPHVDWYRALADYRFACITARAYELHVTGKHVDTAWDVNAEALPLWLEHGQRMLRQ